MLKWINLENGLKNCSTVDSLAQSQIEQERQRWRDILEQLLAIVNFLASHKLAFRDHREKLTSDSSSTETSETTSEPSETGDAASSCVQAKSFFGLLQRSYTLFAGSSQRWAILNAYVKSLSLKPLSETRWECRVASVKAVKLQLSDICDALKDLVENTTDLQLVNECHSIEKEITTYEFVVSLVIWYDIFTKINAISKMWLCENMHLYVAIPHLDAFTNWLDNYRENGFQSSLVTVREIAEENYIDRQFKEVRRRRKKGILIMKGKIKLMN
ncbi:hypothetical protein EVAR_76875_1 [Eumeta japonica]|uniref:Uncharacterized protein n=1 Tax=Eumeta variegata TaxID=151549 RepID=A0A4C1SHH3_EUMVA|nr:hypothetical protein EVAR_76875_1 [Eumeta japonica]